jgi:hypothetical protein
VIRDTFARHEGRSSQCSMPISPASRCLMDRTVADSARIRNFALARQLVSWVAREEHLTERHMNGLIYIIGLIVVILFILSLFGLR